MKEDFTPTEESLDYQREFSMIEEDRKQTLQQAAKQGRINVILSFKAPVYPRIKIVQDREGKRHHSLAFIRFASEALIHTIGVDYPPDDLMIFEPKEKNYQARFVQVAKHLPAFFRDIGANVNVPIHLYQSDKSFKEEHCSGVITQESGFVTIRLGSAIKKAAA